MVRLGDDRAGPMRTRTHFTTRYLSLDVRKLARKIRLIANSHLQWAWKDQASYVQGWVGIFVWTKPLPWSTAWPVSQTKQWKNVFVSPCHQTTAADTDRGSSALGVGDESPSSIFLELPFDVETSGILRTRANTARMGAPMDVCTG